jgi:hypothetical protein
MENGRWNWYGVADEPEEDYFKGWFWCPERKDYFRYKEWLNL